jgi:zinc transport system substrate-binding protein
MRTLAVILLLSLACLDTAGAQQRAPLEVVVSIPPQAYFVERIGGDHTRVTVMVEPGYEPDNYEPRPSQLVAIAGGDLYLAIGVPFERTWLARIKEINPAMSIVECNKGVSPHSPGDPGNGRPVSAAHSRDPHIWTSPVNAQYIAGNTLAALLAARPSAAEDFNAGYQVLNAELQRLHVDIQQQLETVKRRTILVYHPAWGHFAETYNLTQLAVETEGKEPGPASLARIIDQAKAAQINTVFIQAQFSDIAARRVADALNAKLVSIDPLARDYTVNMAHVAALISESLR